MSWSFQYQRFKGILQLVEAELLTYMKIMAIVSSKRKTPYQPFGRAKKKVFLINVISLSSGRLTIDDIMPSGGFSPI